MHPAHAWNALSRYKSHVDQQKCPLLGLQCSTRSFSPCCLHAEVQYKNFIPTSAYVLKGEGGWRLLFWQLCCCPSASSVWVNVRVSLGECSPHVASLCCPLLYLKHLSLLSLLYRRNDHVWCYVSLCAPWLRAVVCMLPSPPWCQVPRRSAVRAAPSTWRACNLPHPTHFGLQYAVALGCVGVALSAGSEE